MGGRTSLALWCVIASACSGSGEIPEKLTKIANNVDGYGQRRFLAQGETFYLQTTKVGANGVALVQEETDYRKFFSPDSKVVVTTDTQHEWQGVGAAESLFVFSDSDGDGDVGGAHWPGQSKIELYRCNQGGNISLYGRGERPAIFLDCFNCNLGCDSLATYRDAAIFVGDIATHTFHMACAPDFGKPRDVVPISKYFVVAGSDFVRVSQINSANEMDRRSTRQARRHHRSVRHLR